MAFSALRNIPIHHFFREVVNCDSDGIRGVQEGIAETPPQKIKIWETPPYLAKPDPFPHIRWVKQGGKFLGVFSDFPGGYQVFRGNFYFRL